MALPLLAIGEAVGEAALHGLFGHKGAPHGKGLLGDLGFGLQLKQKLDQLGTDGSGLLAQFAGMLQAGTPMADIIDRIAKDLSGALAGATGNDGNTTRRRTLERALAAALAPPGTSPPNQSRLQEAAALEKRLGDLLSKISRELSNAGQQNRFSGAVLDANSAREIPAQQQKEQSSGTNASAAPLALAESILRGVLQQLQQQAPQQTAQQPPAQAAQPLQLAQLVQQTSAPAAAQNAAQRADILGRMLARAASADAQRQSAAPAPAVPVTAAHPTPATNPSPSELFARLTAVIAQASQENTSNHGGGKQSAEFAFTKDALPQTHAPSLPLNGPAAPAFSTAIATASAPAGQNPALPLTPYLIDAQSVIEQVVKGIVLRGSGATSELRMRLQPENLGDVALKLTVTGNTITANIVAQNADVRHTLLANQQQLARSLAEAGLSLGKFSVDVSGGNPGFSQQQSQQQRALSKTGALHLNAVAEDDTWADSRLGPPVLTGTRSIVLNYLA